MYFQKSVMYFYSDQYLCAFGLKHVCIVNFFFMIFQCAPDEEVDEDDEEVLG